MFSFNDNRKTVNEIFTMFDEGKLIVDDTYQRRSVWSEKDKVRLIETILLQLVIPELFFWKVHDGLNRFGLLLYNSTVSAPAQALNFAMNSREFPRISLAAAGRRFRLFQEILILPCFVLYFLCPSPLKQMPPVPSQ